MGKKLQSNILILYVFPTLPDKSPESAGFHTNLQILMLEILEILCYNVIIRTTALFFVRLMIS